MLQEIRDGRSRASTGPSCSSWYAKARTFFVVQRTQEGRSLRILAANGIRWIALDLAAMAEGLIVVPLYSRQAPSDSAAIIKDSGPSLIAAVTRLARWNTASLGSDAPPLFV